MERLVPHVQHYAWGDETAIPELIGADPDGRPWAELWIGDHAALPSTVASTGQPLDVGLPFLLKILAAAEPLSIQTHPSINQARAGFRRENAAGIPIDSPRRIYRDPNHKPELICALTPFDALVGFRHPSDVIADVGHVEALSPLVDRLDGAEPVAALRTAVTWILGLETHASAVIIEAVAPDIDLVADLARVHPGDPGALVALLLHRIRLGPGEAVFLGPGNVHAYLSGVGVELMANSDNVVRGGLTSKHVDVDELLAVASFEPFRPILQRATDPVHRFDAEGVEFALTRMEPSEPVRVDPIGQEVVLVTSGRVEIRAEGGAELVLSPGEAGYVDGSSPYQLKGNGVAWRAAARG
jgi:mannose-6-phosphate isomerase